jgi:hypothetical protein
MLADKPPSGGFFVCANEEQQVMMRMTIAHNTLIY